LKGRIEYVDYWDLLVEAPPLEAEMLFGGYRNTRLRSLPPTLRGYPQKLRGPQVTAFYEPVSATLRTGIEFRQRPTDIRKVLHKLISKSNK
jgi:hypothetical protein